MSFLLHCGFEIRSGKNPWFSPLHVKFGFKILGMNLPSGSVALFIFLDAVFESKANIGFYRDRRLSLYFKNGIKKILHLPFP